MSARFMGFAAIVGCMIGLIAVAFGTSAVVGGFAALFCWGVSQICDAIERR